MQMRLFLLSVTATLFLSGNAHAKRRVPAGETLDAHCEDFNPRDMFAKDFRFPAQSKYPGQCYDTSEARPVKILSDAEVDAFLKTRSNEEAQRFAGPREGFTFVANFSHDHKFWVARIPDDAVEDVYYQIEYFPVLPVIGTLPPLEKLSSHSILRIIFQDGRPVELLPQDPAERPHVVSLKSIESSDEAVLKKGDPFDLLFKGQNNFYGMGYRFTSLDDKVEDMVVKQNHNVDQVKLNVDNATKQKILKFALGRSDQSYREGMPDMYHTLQRSCITEAFRTIDASTGYKASANDPAYHAYLIVRSAVDMRLPAFLSRGLEVRNVQSKEKIPSLNQEVKEGDAWKSTLELSSVDGAL